MNEQEVTELMYEVTKSDINLKSQYKLKRIIECFCDIVKLTECKECNIDDAIKIICNITGKE